MPQSPAVPHRGSISACAALLVCTALIAPGLALAQALPQGGQFVAGQGSIGAAAANALTITQTSARGVIDWRSFNIGQGASVTFNNGAGATLNRVTGGDLSQILGTLRATGSLYLVNPQGVVIGSSGVVVTGGRFVASSLDIANDAFMAGGTLVFRGTTENAEVRNLGAISSTGGDVILISRAVRNEGTITAPRGTAALATGTEVLLREGPEGHRGLVRVRGASGDVTNTGRIEAAQAELRAAGGNIYALAGNTEGAIRATGTETRQGRVWLSAGAGTTSGNVITEGRVEARNADGTGGKVSLRAGNAVSNTGTLSADGSRGGAVRVRAARVVQQGTVSARGTSGAGGTVHVLGEQIALTGAQIDTSGTTGGGVVRIGGGVRGGEGLPQASTVAADAATTIRADATQRGTGGDVVVWSENRTDFAGRIEARGGAEGGDGGQAEVSSRGVLAYTGTTDLRAAQGAWGTLLLDPYNITISNGTQTTGGPPGFTPNADDSVINANDLMTALGMANVTVSTGLASSPGSQAGNITVTAPLEWSSGSTLTLQANSAINLNAAITAPAGALALDAGTTLGATGAIGVGRFELVRGAWVQNATTLAGLSAGDFRLTGGTFLRTTGGAGSSGNPWLLTDIYGVQGMGTRLNEHYRLTADIDAAGTAAWNAGAGFRPIGFSISFTGSFNGGGHTISGLTINRPAVSNVGLFGSNLGTVTNIGLLGGSVRGANFSGALVGINAGTITQAYATGTVMGGASVGGLVGRNNNTITQAYATGAASGVSNVGGLVGLNQGAITRAYATGAVSGSVNTGGLVGANGGTITQAYASGAVSGGAGLVGSNGGTITASFWDTQTTGRAVGIADGNTAGATGRTTAQARSQAGYTGWNFTTDWFQAGDMRPIGRWEAAQPGTDGVRVIRNLHQLQLMATLPSASYRLAADINASPTNAAANSPGIWGAGGFVPVGNSTAAFTGSLDGAGRVISGLTINRPTLNDVGLFGVTGTGTTIANIGLVGGSVTGVDRVGMLVGTNGGAITQAHATGNAIGVDMVGGLVGHNVGTITQAHATGTVTGSNHVGGLVGYGEFFSAIAQAFTSGAVTGHWDVGGLVGYNAGTITQAYSTGPVSGDSYVGGLVGVSTGATITQAYATGAVTGNDSVGGLVGGFDGAITQVYATGAVTGVTNVGGLVGITGSDGTISASFWNTQTTGQAHAVSSGPITDGAFGRTTAEMQDITTFRTTYAGPGFAWDFDTVWAPPNQVGQNHGATTAFYPQLYSVSTVAAVFVPDASRIYGDANPAFGLPSYRGLRAGDTIGTAATIGTTAITTSNVGAHPLTASGTTVISPQGRTYRIVHVPGTLTITPRPVTIEGSRAYDGTAAIADGVLSVTNLVGSDTLTLTGTGSVASPNASVTPQALSFGSLALGGARAANYTLAGGSGTAVITPRPVTLEGSRAYDGTNVIAGEVLSVTNLVGTDTLSLTGTGAVASPHVAAGAQALSFGSLALGGASAANYTLAGGSGTVVITPRPLTVTANPQTRVYGDANPALTFQLGGLGLVPGDTLTGALATAATPTSNVGPYAITQGSLDNPNYAIAFTSNDLTITPRPVTLTGSRAYDGTNVIAGGVLSVTNLVGTDTLSLAGTGAVASPHVAAGAQALGFDALALSGASAANYTLAGASGTVVITSRPLTVTADPQSRVYGDANPALTFQLGGLGLVPGDTLTGALATAATPTSNVGPYAITQGSLDNPNYAITFTGNDLTITQRPVTLAGSRAYDGTTTVAASALNVTNLVGTDILTLSGTASVASPNASPTPQALSFGTLALSGASAANYTLAGGSGTVVITPRPLTVTANPQNRVYGDANAALTFQLGGLGLIPGDTLAGALATTATPTSNVGAYAITQGSLDNPNYAITFTGSDLTITPATLILTADNARWQQGAPKPFFSFSIAGLVAGDGPSVVKGVELRSPATAQSPPGLYPITPIGGSAANYILVRLPGVLTVLAQRPEAIPDALHISTSNIPPPQAQLPTAAKTDPPVDPQPIPGSSTTVPLQQAAGGACGAEIEAGILGCTSGFPLGLN